MDFSRMPPVGRAKGRLEAQAKKREICACLDAGFEPLDIAEMFGTTERAILLVQEECELEETA